MFRRWISTLLSCWSRIRQRFGGGPRVPVLLQMNNVECGAACLAMILSYYGRKTTVAECRDQCQPGRDALSARDLYRAAQTYGLRVRAFSIEGTDGPQLPLPAIAHWEFNHFVVIERWTNDTIEVVDPGVGRRRLTPSEFSAAFTGVVLTLEPGDRFERRAGRRAFWRDYLRGLLHFPGTRTLVVQVFAASLVLQIFGLLVPLFTKVLVDRILPFHITNLLAILGLGILTLVLAQLTLTYLRSGLLIFLQGRLDGRMMLGFFEHVLSLPFAFFQQRSSGDLLMRLSSNAVIRGLLTTQTVSIVLDGMFVLVYLVLLLCLDPLFAVIALGLGVVQITLLLSTTKRIQNLTQESLAADALSQSYLVEALTGIATLKACGGEDRALEHWSNLFYKELNVTLRKSHVEAVIDTATTGFHVLAPLLLLWVGAYRVLDGTLSLGVMLALNALALSFLTPLVSLASTAQRLQLVGVYLERIADVLRAEPEQDPQTVTTAPKLTGRIELKKVSFRYAPGSPWVLRDICLSIKPGQKVALVGSSGSGKTTLAMLLLGLHLPTEGEILYDGIPLQSVNYRTLRTQFGVVLQDATLFSGSIRQNIALNDPGLDLEGVVQAARLAAIEDEIMQMPMAYDTRIAEGGTGLSGGQCQRLVIARALAHKPAIMLLDEATSHLDVISEQIVDRNLSDLSCTRVVIAHRLSTIRNADQILVLSDGIIVERGTHEELLALKGAYEELTRSQ